MDFAGRVGAKSLGFTALLSIAALFYSKDAAVAVFAGGLVGFANFRLSSKFLKKIIVPEMNPSLGRALGVLSFFGRYALLTVVLVIIIKSGIPPLFFMVGLSAIVGAALFSYNDLKRETV